MGKRLCAVCGKSVRDGDETEHLRSNHLGPHYFWIDAKKIRTMEPSLTGGAIKRLADTAPIYQLFLEKADGKSVAIADDTAVDLTREPHLWAAPYATTFCG